MKKGKRLTVKEWAEIEELWALGEVTLDEVADRYGMNQSYLSRELSRRKVKKGSKKEEVVKEAKEKIRETVGAEPNDLAVKIRDTKSEQYNYSRTLSRMIYATIANCVKNGHSVATVKEEVRCLKEAQQGISIGRTERWKILGLDVDHEADDALPVLTIKEMTADDIRAIESGQAEDPLGMDFEEIDQLTSQSSDAKK